MSRKSLVWEHFCTPYEIPESKIKETVCKWCNDKFAYHGTTSNLMNHLERRHLGVLKKSKDHSAGTTGSSSTGTSKRPCPAGSEKAAGTVAKQTRLDFRLPLTAQKEEKMTELITNVVVGDMRPLAFVEGENFKALMNYLEPKYTVPSRRTITRRVEILFEERKSQLKQELQAVTSIAITFDAWTSIKTEAFLGVTGHFINENFELKSYCLAVKALHDRHTAEHIVNWVEEILEDYGIAPERVTAAVTDNGSNMKAARHILNEKYDWESVGCTAHSLQLCLTHGFKLQPVERCLAAARRLVQHFKRSELSTSALNNKCVEMEVEPKKLIMDVATRWNSTYNMIERVVAMQWPLLAVLGDRSLPVSKNAATLAPRSSDWELMKGLVPVLKPFAEATDSLGGDNYVSLSLRNPCVKGLKKHLTQISQEVGPNTVMSQFCDVVRQQLTERFYYEMTDVTARATAVDPRYRLRGLHNEDAKKIIKDSLESELAIFSGSPSSALRPGTSAEQSLEVSMPSTPTLAQIVVDACDSSESSDTNENENKICEELDKFFSLKFTKAEILEIKPLDWWKCNKHHYPLIAKIVPRLLGIPASSTPSERVFSTSGNISSATRSSLTGSHVEALVFLKTNGKKI